MIKYLLAILAVILITLAAGAFFYLGRGYKPGTVGTPTTTATPTPQPKVSQPLAETPQPTKTVTGGGILSFPKYQITVPVDWSDSKEILGPDAEKLILKKGSYQISITEGGFGGAICLFPGDPDIEGPSARYETYVDLTTQGGNLFRRVGAGTGGGFAICEKTQYGWNAPSSYGHISIKTPTTADPQMIEEVDSILSSFETT